MANTLINTRLSEYKIAFRLKALLLGVGMDKITLIASNYDEQTGIFTFFFHNTETNWYYEMSCRNSFGTKDMHSRVPTMTREEFVRIAGERLA